MDKLVSCFYCYLNLKNHVYLYFLLLFEKYLSPSYDIIDRFLFESIFAIHYVLISSLALIDCFRLRIVQNVSVYPWS
jgi:hypothetical protein